MLLAVDTSNEWMGLALYDGSQVIGESAWRSRQHHTVELAPAIQDLLTRCGSSMDDITALGIALGPGSFTSLRVGLALAKGLALARGLALIGIPTLEIVAQSQPVLDNPMVVAILAGRGRFAIGWYEASGNQWQARGEARVATIVELMKEVQAPSWLCGEFSGEVRRDLIKNKFVRLASPAKSVRRPGVLAELAWARFQHGERDEAASLAPIYLHTGAPIES